VGICTSALAEAEPDDPLVTESELELGENEPDSRCLDVVKSVTPELRRRIDNDKVSWGELPRDVIDADGNEPLRRVESAEGFTTTADDDGFAAMSILEFGEGRGPKRTSRMRVIHLHFKPGQSSDCEC
jgi:hypothetical protein